jgi:hypothetical protein
MNIFCNYCLTSVLIVFTTFFTGTAAFFTGTTAFFTGVVAFLAGVIFLVATLAATFGVAATNLAGLPVLPATFCFAISSVAVTGAAATASGITSPVKVIDFTSSIPANFTVKCFSKWLGLAALYVALITPVLPGAIGLFV